MKGLTPQRAVIMPQYKLAMNHAERPINFVDLEKRTPQALAALAYAKENNFVGEIIDGYQANRALLTKEAAVALAAIQIQLKPLGLGIKILDAYRPQQAMNQFIAWAVDAEDVSTKVKFYPCLTKK